MKMLAAFVGCALIAQSAVPSHPGTQAHPGAPGPRSPIAGFAGFQSVSKVDFGEHDNRLTAVYCFPDRVRWSFEDYARSSPGRQNFYRSGDALHELSGGRSQQLTGETLDLVLLQMELRRAAMLWPDGFEWKPESDDVRRTEVYADSCCRARRLGSLVARGAGAPASFEARAGDDRLVEAIDVSERQEVDGRSWPKTLVVRGDGGGFTETVESVETNVYFLDVAFLPCDRRELPPASSTGPRIVASDLVAVTLAVHDLAASTTWTEALQRAQRWSAEAQEALRPQGLLVDPVPTFELTPEGRPLRCLVRLRSALATPPDGFQSIAERPGLLLSIEKVEQIDAALLKHLASAVPRGAGSGTPYLRVHAGDVPRIELVLPLIAPE